MSCPQIKSAAWNIDTLFQINRTSNDNFVQSLPFVGNDATAGTENELQAVVVGDRHDIDLAQQISNSTFLKNILRRASAGESPRQAVTELEKFLDNNRDRIWENSWVQFPLESLSPYARQIFSADLQADKKNHQGTLREDAADFLFSKNGAQWLRVPVSYLLKLSLADIISSPPQKPFVLEKTARQLLDHFLNDNTSPETFSFYVASCSDGHPPGRATAIETAIRFLLTQLLTIHANKQFHLQENGQQALVYFAPHPPIRLRQLNELISDSFYRELFMSPCLSGWDKGQEKHRYMGFCHTTLSRSQLNAVKKLREAGIITSNLVILPNTSNISLANNGTHISLGSRKLTALLKDPASGYTAIHEKYFGDLVIKITEHFLPLFVSTYSAAPYRLDFVDFHPERALGFLPHELDYTHLRMIWRRWKKKADLKICGQPLTPFGPSLIDGLLRSIFRLRGDYIPDFRLIDYFVALMSTNESPALDGFPGNTAKLKKDLAALGIFDSSMADYMLYRMREFNKIGFTGFEGRYYSLFENFASDLADAADMQTLITALAYKFIINGSVRHSDIPDCPTIESERRQIFFSTAIDLPTFFVKENTPNLFLRRILKSTGHTRKSRRYPGYIRTPNKEFRLALLTMIRQDGADLIEYLHMEATINRLEKYLASPSVPTAEQRLQQGILTGSGAKTPMALPAAVFNRRAEVYYRDQLRRQHINESLALFTEEFGALQNKENDDYIRHMLTTIIDDQSIHQVIDNFKHQIDDDDFSSETIQPLIWLVILLVFLLESRQQKQTKEAAGNSPATIDSIENIHSPQEKSHASVY